MKRNTRVFEEIDEKMFQALREITDNGYAARIQKRSDGGYEVFGIKGQSRPSDEEAVYCGIFPADALTSSAAAARTVG